MRPIVTHGRFATQQTLNICITFIQRRPNVFDVGPALYKCHTNVFCLLGSHVYAVLALLFKQIRKCLG